VAEPSPWRTVKQTAARAQCGPKVIYAAIRANRLRAARLNGRRDLRIHETWLDDWLRASSEPVDVTPSHPRSPR
jgi:excisionase family DNA binding protein